MTATVIDYCRIKHHKLNILLELTVVRNMALVLRVKHSKNMIMCSINCIVNGLEELGLL